jgi:sodium transport system permease protein
MNWNNIFAIYCKELVDQLRDRRTLISVIVIPTVAIPLMVFGMGRVMSGVIKKAEAEVPAITIDGGQDSPGVIAELQQSPKFRVVEWSEDFKKRIEDKKLRIAIGLPPKFEAGLKAGAAPDVTIYYFQNDLNSGIAARAAEDFFKDLRERTVAARLEERGLPKEIVHPFAFARKNVAPDEKVGGSVFGGFVPYLIIILCFTGAMYPAMDLTAGEKERGTMETLLCSPVPRVDIVFGKFLMVLTGSLSAMAFALTSMGITASLGGAIMMGGGASAKLGGTVAAKSATESMGTIDPTGLLGVLAKQRWESMPLPPFSFGQLQPTSAERTLRGSVSSAHSAG